MARDERRGVGFLLDLDPDLGTVLPGGRMADARAALQVAVQRLPAGAWHHSRPFGANPGHLGLLVLEGVLARDVVIEGSVSTELLGTGDVVRPWQVAAGRPVLRYEVRWSVLADVEVAMLDRRLAIALARFPEVHAALLERLDRRSERLAASKAIVHLNRVDRRLLAVFWHLAERWGRVTPDGVVIPLTLSHRMLGNLIGARRPTVSTALGELTRRGAVARRPDGGWLVTGEP